MSSSHIHPVEVYRHEHVFLGASHDENAKRVWTVVALTTVMMIAEIAGGTLSGSLALVADGWHMSTHAAALTISALAYSFARRHARDGRFAFGTGKLGDLASFTSAIVLGMIGLLIAYEAIDHLIHPLAIAYNEAIAIAALGLAVNLLSGWLLRDDHGHDHTTTIVTPTTMMAITITTITTSICARPMSTFWPMRWFRCLLLAAC